MSPGSPSDESRLQAYYDTEAKYHPDPVPTPLDRAVAIAFVNGKLNATTPSGKLRKLMRVAVFYDLHETAAVFAKVLRDGESQAIDVYRAAFCLIALAWVGDATQQEFAQQYFHALQGRADAEEHRDNLLEVVEAFGPREGTEPHRRWIQGAIATLEGRLRQEQIARDNARATLTREQINSLTEHLSIELPAVDEEFVIRRGIDALTPDLQVQPLVACSLDVMPEGTPQLSYWASMRLLRLPVTIRQPIAAEFHRAGSAHADDDLVRATAFRAAEYFGSALSAADRTWLAGQPDAGTDPLVLRPQWYR